jgi:hypothetical protein
LKERGDGGEWKEKQKGWTKDGRTDEELRDGGEKKGRCVMREREERYISDEGEKRRRRETGER